MITSRVKGAGNVFPLRSFRGVYFFLLAAVWGMIGTSCSDTSAITFIPENDCWDSEQVWTFELEQKEAEGMEIRLRFTDAYPFSNLYLKLEVEGPQGWKQSYRQTETFIDPYGNWQVEQKGSYFPVIFSSFSNLDLPAAGTYYFRLTHDMRKEPLCGIQQLELALNSEQ